MIEFVQNALILINRFWPTQGTRPGTSQFWCGRLETKYILKKQFWYFLMNLIKSFNFFHETKLFIRFFKEIYQKWKICDYISSHLYIFDSSHPLSLPRCSLLEKSRYIIYIWMKRFLISTVNLLCSSQI